MKQLSEELETAYTTGNEIVHNHDADFLRGEQLLILAAEVGHADAAALLATIYFDDFCSSGTFRMGGPAWWGKRQDYPLGLTYLNLAVALNHGMSRLTMAHFLLHGKEELGLEVDFHKGMELLDQLDRENFLPALLYKYDMVSQRVIPVEDVLKVATQDSIDQSILALLERASGLGDAKTSFQLAQFYFGCNDRIDGYLPEATIDIEKGMHYLHLSLTQGHLNDAFFCLISIK
jgi:TPR repeat protein